MSLQEMSVFMQDGLIGLAVILLGLIRIPKVDLNLWSLLARFLGKSINGELIERIDKVDKLLECHISKTEQQRADQARQRILRFCDEILLGQLHSKDHYDEVLNDIDKYETYCHTHPEYLNNKAVMAIEAIKDSYQERIEKHDFLVYTKD